MMKSMVAIGPETNDFQETNSASYAKSYLLYSKKIFQKIEEHVTFLLTKIVLNLTRK